MEKTDKVSSVCHAPTRLDPRLRTSGTHPRLGGFAGFRPRTTLSVIPDLIGHPASLIFVCKDLGRHPSASLHYAQGRPFDSASFDFASLRSLRLRFRYAQDRQGRLRSSPTGAWCRRVGAGLCARPSFLVPRENNDAGFSIKLVLSLWKGCIAPFLHDLL